MNRLLICILATVGLLACGAAFAEDWSEYPQFRHNSALPGNGFGVDQDGEIGFHGAFHMNVPCAYTPSAGNFTGAYYCASEDTSIRFKAEGDKTNGTAHIGLGLLKPGGGLFISEVFVDKDFVNTVNLQWQVLDEDKEMPAVAVGILDIFDQRQKNAGIDGGARSFYVTATREIETSSKPLFVTLGLGDGRFNGLFGAVTWYPSHWVNVGFEYDGRIERPYAGFKIYECENWSFGAAAAWSNFDRPVVGFNLGYSR